MDVRLTVGFALLQEESSTYCERVSQIIGAGNEAVSKIEHQAKNIEAIKLAAIGQRNKLSATKESQAKEERDPQPVRPSLL